jgi:chromosome segregation ATPase
LETPVEEIAVTRISETRASPSTSTASRIRGNWVHFLFSGVILLGSMAYYQSTQAEALRHEVDLLRRDNTMLRLSLSKSDHSLQQALAEFHNELAGVHAKIETAHTESGENVAMAQAAATRHADVLMNQLEKKRRQLEEREKQMSAELNNIRRSTDETSTRLNYISRDVGNVKNEVESVKSSERQSTATIQQARGDLGAIGGIVATTAEEIQMLRELGDRNIFEFALIKGAGMQRVGDIQVNVEKTDARKNTFTVEIMAADQKVEKRDKNINEPVQFYVPGKGKQPYELVVNEVGKNTLKGYLASPKVTISRGDF